MVFICVSSTVGLANIQHMFVQYVHDAKSDGFKWVHVPRIKTLVNGRSSQKKRVPRVLNNPNIGSKVYWAG